MLALAIKNTLLQKDAKELFEKNEALSKELKGTITLLNDSVKDLLNLQDINELGLKEEEKNQHRNIIINRLINLYIQKSKELTTTVQSNS